MALLTSIDPFRIDKQTARRIDETDGTVIYSAYADIGTVDSDSKWQIKRITFSGATHKIEWADGNNNFDNVWDNRGSLTYI